MEGVSHRPGRDVAGVGWYLNTHVHECVQKDGGAVVLIERRMGSEVRDECRAGKDNQM